MEAVILIAGALLVLALVNTLYFRSKTRPCPCCGRRVAVGSLDCQSCGFDFRTL